MLLPFNTLATITVSNSERYSKQEKTNWHLKIWFIPLYGVISFRIQHGSFFDEGVSEKSKEKTLRDAKEESSSLFDDIDL